SPSLVPSCRQRVNRGRERGRQSEQLFLSWPFSITDSRPDLGAKSRNFAQSSIRTRFEDWRILLPRGNVVGSPVPRDGNEIGYGRSEFGGFGRMNARREL